MRDVAVLVTASAEYKLAASAVRSSITDIPENRIIFIRILLDKINLSY